MSRHSRLRGPCNVGQSRLLSASLKGTLSQKLRMQLPHRTTKSASQTQATIMVCLCVYEREIVFIGPWRKSREHLPSLGRFDLVHSPFVC